MRARSLLAVLCATAATSSLVCLAAPADAAVAKPTAFKLAKGGQHNDGLRVQWGWKSGVSSYEVQAATDSAFTQVAADETVAGKSKKPSGGVLADTVDHLQNASVYYLRVRALSKGTPSAWSSTVKSSTKVAWPSKFSGVTAEAGPEAGELTFSWQQDGAYTTEYQLETALTMFSKTSSDLPRTGRNDRVFTIPAGQHSVTLTADQVADAGASLGSGNHLVWRFSAVNAGTAGTQVRSYAGMHGIMPRASASASGQTARSAAATTDLRVVSFNVRTAKAVSDARPWLSRADQVATQIVDANPDVVSLQELGPGRADGQDGSTTGVLRQTTSLEVSLAKIKASRYTLVRTTPYNPAGTVHGSQGTRILYDTTKLSLVSDCQDTTGKQSYSTSCSVELPLLSGDDEGLRRTAAWAEFQQKASGQKFFFVSAHLDDRHSSKTASETTYNNLRGQQMKKILDTVAALNTDHLPVVVGGDMNSWQNIQVGNAPHDTLVGAGFFDSASAPDATNLQYSTFNNFQLVQTPSGVGYGSRLDGIYVKGGTASTFKIFTKATDPQRASDHNMIASDLVLDQS